MRFHLDEDGSQVVSALGRERYRLDISSSHELGLEGMTDGELLRWCGLQERCVVTKNGKDFIRLTRQFQAEGLSHAGVLVIPRSIENDEFARIARALAWFQESHPEGVPPYFVDYLRDPPGV
ncbi:MAG: DUF5615 family PIN-like protein [Dehalococcoidia bacterium]